MGAAQTGAVLFGFGLIRFSIIAAIFYPFSQFCEIGTSSLSLQNQPKTAPNLFQRGVEYAVYGRCSTSTRSRGNKTVKCRAQGGPQDGRRVCFVGRPLRTSFLFVFVTRRSLLVLTEFPCVVLWRPEALDCRVLIPPEAWSWLTRNPPSVGLEPRTSCIRDRILNH